MQYDARRRGNSYRYRNWQPIVIYLDPFHLPDETHASQAARYHRDSGNAEPRRSLIELYDCVPTGLLNWIPPVLDRFVSKLPGEFERNLENALRFTTHFPLFETFNETRLDLASADKTLAERLQNAPKRLSGERIRLQLCIDCMHAEQQEAGQPYIHRTHLAPGVSVCPIHKTRLIFACPHCGRPFESGKALIEMPWSPCAGCGRSLQHKSFRQVERAASGPEFAYAAFAHDVLLNGGLALTSQVLAALYRLRAEELGFAKNNRVDRLGLTNALVDHFGAGFVRQADAAYRDNKISNWLRMLAGSSSSEVPLPRHLMLAQFLFGSEHQFRNFVLCHADRLSKEVEERTVKISQRHPPRPPRPPRTAQNDKAPLVRADSGSQDGEEIEESEIAQVKAALEENPNWTIEDLWKHRRSKMKSLFAKHENAKGILDELLTRPVDTPPGERQGPQSDESTDDMAWAILISTKAIVEYGGTTRPVKLTPNRLLALAGWKRSNIPRSDEFPLSRQQVDANCESQWHYLARRILHAKLSNPSLVPGSRKIIQISGVEFYRAKALFEHFGSTLASTNQLKTGTIMKLLEDLGITKTWAGPSPDQRFLTAGRAYVRVGVNRPSPANR